MSAELTAAEIFRPLQRAPWPSARPVLTLAIEVLPVVTDDLGADIIEQAAVAIADLTEELRAVRAVLSETLTQAHEHQREIARLRQRLAGLHEQIRSARSVAA